MILYYSGTGNSRYVAQEMARLMNDHMVRLTKETPTEVTFTNEPLGLVFPVHSWGIPKRMAKFLKAMTWGKEKPTMCYAILTCGDDAALTNVQLRNVLANKGIFIQHIYAVRMPNTYIVFPGFNVDKEELRNEKIAETTALLPHLAEAIKNNAPTQHYITTGHAWLKSKIIYPLFMKLMMNDKPFFVTDQCNGCGLCAKQCCESNIVMHDNHPVWQHQCTQCLGCIHHCPKQAIEYGKQTQNKGRSHM
ncbi:MAG: EFR1 family ferrodoxin [Bacteroidales bacterium]|nr:EFR1 family ferrodoxin [Bacteroidales bacterium]